MRKIICWAVAFLAMAASAVAQTYPSPQYQNMTIHGTLTLPGGNVGTSSLYNIGTSVKNPGTGTLEAVLPIQTVTATSHTFVTADLFTKVRRSNAGTAMTDTFPSSLATGMANGTRLDIVNTDASASDTITAGAGTLIGTNSTYVIPAGRDVMFVYDSANTTWRLDANTGITRLFAPTAGLWVSESTGSDSLNNCQQASRPCKTAQQASNQLLKLDMNGNQASINLVDVGPTLNAAIAGTVLTVNTISASSVSGSQVAVTTLQVGSRITGAGVTLGTTITSFGTGTGGTGTYNLSASSTVSSESMTASAVYNQCVAITAPLVGSAQQYAQIVLTGQGHNATSLAPISQANAVKLNGVTTCDPNNNSPILTQQTVLATENLTVTGYTGAYADLWQSNNGRAYLGPDTAWNGTLNAHFHDEGHGHIETNNSYIEGGQVIQSIGVSQYGLFEIDPSDNVVITCEPGSTFANAWGQAQDIGQIYVGTTTTTSGCGTSTGPHYLLIGESELDNPDAITLPGSTSGVNRGGWYITTGTTPYLLDIGLTVGGTLTGNGAVALSPANANVVLSPTGTGVVTINPATAGTMNNVVIGGSTALAGTFTTITGTAMTITQSGSGTDQINFLEPSLATSTATQLVLGAAKTSANAVVLSFNNVGTGSSSNFGGLGLYNGSNALQWDGNANVAIHGTLTTIGGGTLTITPALSTSSTITSAGQLTVTSGGALITGTESLTGNLNITNTGSGQGVDMTLYKASVGNGNNVQFAWGQSAASNAAGILAYNYNSGTPANSYVALGLYNGNFGIEADGNTNVILTHNNSSTLTLAANTYANCTGLTTNGSGVVGCTPSDPRVKDFGDKIEPEAALATILTMPDAYDFTFKKGYGPSGRMEGFSALEVQKAHPEWVIVGAPNALAPDGELQFDPTNKLVPELVQALKAEDRKIEAVAAHSDKDAADPLVAIRARLEWQQEEIDGLAVWALLATAGAFAFRKRRA